MDTKLKKLYELQTGLIYEYENEIDTGNNYDLTEIDIIEIKDLISEALIKNGYKRPSEEEFSNKIEYFFSISKEDIEKNKRLIKNHTSFFTLIYKDTYETIDTVEYTEFFYRNKNYYFIKELNFMIPLTFLPDIIDYSEIDKDTAKVVLPKYILHQNLFLFNDSKASLTWLLQNDINFLRNLLLTKGFDKNNKINRAVLDNKYEYYEQSDFSKPSLLDGLFASKTVSNKIRMHENLLNYIVEITTTKEFKDYTLLEDFAYYVWSVYHKRVSTSSDILGNMDKAEMVKFITTLFYYIELVWEKCDPAGLRDWKAGSMMRNHLIFDKEILEEIEKNNYYDNPEIERMINKNIDIAHDGY